MCAHAGLVCASYALHRPWLGTASCRYRLSGLLLAAVAAYGRPLCAIYGCNDILGANLSQLRPERNSGSIKPRIRCACAVSVLGKQSLMF